MNYWLKAQELKDKAQEHTERMARDYKAEIEVCSASSTVYGGSGVNPSWPSQCFIPAMQYVKQLTTTDALFRIKEATHRVGRVAVLNFASYTNPGGKFMEGSSAQEESLCHASFLYNVLRMKDDFYEWNNAHKNRGLYTDRALYTPNVVFFDAQGNKETADVITCAAPNRSLLEKYGSFTEQENKRALQQRIDFIQAICQNNMVDTIILGAWGCGVFKQDPKTVAFLFKEAFAPTGKRVIYAVPDEETYKVFTEVITPEYALDSLELE